MIPSARRLLPGVAMLMLAAIPLPLEARPLPEADLPPGLRAGPMPAASARARGRAWRQTGIASWYRAPRPAARTSSGERYDENGMTAAHPFLPLGTHVRVTRQDTGRSVVVRINDRPAAGSGRAIDLSRAAAVRLDLLHKGLGRVTVTPVAPEEVAEAPELSPRRDPPRTPRAAPSASAARR